MENIAVLDYGSKTLKAGFAYSFPSEDEPRVRTPSAVEIVGSTAVSNGPSSSSKAADVHFPVQHGQITNFDEFEALIHYTLYDLLGWEMGDEGNVIFSEPLLTSKGDREQMTQIMFEVFNVNGLFFQDQATLSLYAIGKNAGCVVDIGAGKVDVATVTDGQLNPSSVRRLTFAGDELTKRLEQLLQAKGVQLHSRHHVELLKEMCCACAETSADFERVCGAIASSASGAVTVPNAAAIAARVLASSGAAGGSGGASSSANGQPSAPTNGSPQTYSLPDGQRITITTEGVQTAECLFRPHLLGAAHNDIPGLAEVTLECVSTQYDGVHRRAGHLDSLLVCGGGSCIPNIPQRLANELRAIASPSTNIGLCAVPEYLQAQHTCKFAPWIGGAVLAKVILQQGHFVSKADYDELGPLAVHRKCC